MAIFKKSDENVKYPEDIGRQETTPAPKVVPTKPARSNDLSVIGPTMVFKGELTADEDLIIEGQVEGTIRQNKKHLTVGKMGRVKADIHASSVIVLGQLVGNIHSNGMVSLSKSADVTGNIICGRITMEDGARLKGSVEMGEQRAVSAVPKESAKAAPAQPEQRQRVPQQSKSAG